MNPVPLAILVALAFALAGCFGGDDDPSPSPTATPPGPTQSPGTSPGPGPTTPSGPTEILLLTQFSFTDCTGIRLLQSAEPATVAALLPDGFTPATQALEGVGPDQAVLVVDLYECGSFQAGTSQFPDVWFGHVFTYVEAPADLYPDRELAADHHEYLFQMIGGKDILAMLWPVAGYDTHNGTTSLTVVPTPLLGAATLTAGEYALSVQGPPAAFSVSGSFARYTVLEDGSTLLWNGQENLAATHYGLGSASVPAGSPFSGLGPVTGDNTLRGEAMLSAQAGFTDQHLVRLLPAAPSM